MNMQKGMTLLEVMVALVVFALAGIALMKTTAQQVRGISWMEDKILASWLADNQMVQLHLDKVWSDKNWNEKTVYFAGKSGTYAGEGRAMKLYSRVLWMLKFGIIKRTSLRLFHYVAMWDANDQTTS